MKRNDSLFLLLVKNAFPFLLMIPVAVSPIKVWGATGRKSNRISRLYQLCHSVYIL